MVKSAPYAVKNGFRRWRGLLEYLARDCVPEVGGLIWTESHFNADAERYEAGYRRRYILGNEVWERRIRDRGWSAHSVSSSYGLMQLMFPTAWALGYRGDPEGLKNPETNLVYGCMLLTGLLDRYGDMGGALAAYNGGSVRKLNGQFVNQRYVDTVLRRTGILRREVLN